MMPGLRLLLSQDIGVQRLRGEVFWCDSTRKGGGGGEAWGKKGLERHQFWCSPPTDSPNPLEEAKLHRRTLGLIYGFTQ